MYRIKTKRYPSLSKTHDISNICLVWCVCDSREGVCRRIQLQNRVVCLCICSSSGRGIFAAISSTGLSCLAIYSPIREIQHTHIHKHTHAYTCTHTHTHTHTQTHTHTHTHIHIHH